MRVGQLVDRLSERSGGVPELAAGIARAAAGGFESHVFGIADGEPPGPRWAAAQVHAARGLGPRGLALAPSLPGRLLAAELDLLHAHGLWTPQSVVTLLWAARRRRPYVVSPHGMLHAWALARSRARKAAAAALYERRRLRRAACVHVLGAFEADTARAFAGPVTVCEIPAAVDLPAEPLVTAPPAWAETDRRVLLYLGRIHPKKGLAGLLRALARVRAADAARAAPWRLVIAGWDEAGHSDELRRRADELGLGAAVVFAGPVTRAARASAYASADACVLPSSSEGLPLTVLEAWAHGRPVLMTDACHLPCGFEAEAALRVTGDADGDARVLSALFAMGEGDRRAMGGRGRALVERRFSWPVTGRQYLDLYSWLLGGGPAPAFVRRA